MFSVFIKNSILDKDPEFFNNFIREPSFQENLKNILKDAKSSIGKIGFPSMRVNLVLDDLRADVNKNTGKAGDVAGYAVGSRKYMIIDLQSLVSTDTSQMSNIIVHEWAHLWFFNNSKLFKSSMENLFNQLKYSVDHKDFNMADALGVNVESIFDKKENFEEIHRSWKDLITKMIHAKVFLGFSILKLQEMIERFINRCFDEYIEYKNSDGTEYDNLVEDYARLLSEEITELLKRITPDQLDKNEFVYNADYRERAYLSITNNAENLPRIVDIMKTILIRIIETDTYTGDYFDELRKFLTVVNNWPTDYGLHNKDELFATAIENFFALNGANRRKIIEAIMS